MGNGKLSDQTAQRFLQQLRPVGRWWARAACQQKKSTRKVLFCKWYAVNVVAKSTFPFGISGSYRQRRFRVPCFPFGPF